MLCYALFCVLSSFAIIFKRERERERERELLAPLCLPSLCLVIVMWLFLMKLWVCLRCVIMVFPGHTRLYFCIYNIITIELYATFIKKTFFGYAEKLKYVKNVM